MNLSKNVLVTSVLDVTSAASTDTEATVLDMSGFEGVLFVARFATDNTSTMKGLHVQAGASSDGSDAIDVTGSEVTCTSTAAAVVVLDVYKPTKRYVEAVLETSASTDQNTITAVQYGARVLPVTQGNEVTLVIGTDSGTI